MKILGQLLLGGALAGIGVLAQAQDVSAARSQQVQIPAQPLIQALNAFAAQTGLQLMYVSAVAEDQQSRGAPGGLSPAQMLTRLLEGTNLTFEFLNKRTVAIRASGDDRKTSALEAPADQMRLAEGRGDAGTDSSTPASKDAASTQQMVVEGARDRPVPYTTANLDLTRTEDDVLPFTVFTARDIELSGAMDLESFLRARLPQDFSAAIPGQGYGNIGSPTRMSNTVDLRGWGDQEAVVLLNGRRLPGRYIGNQTDASFSLADFSSIPVSAIERIEILPAAGSAIYGTNATSGVINIITRRDYTGGQLSVNYESPADTSASNRAVELSYGAPLPWKLQGRIVAGYQRSSPMKMGDRAEDTLYRWFAIMQERAPERLVNSLSSNPLNTSTLRVRATTNIRTVSTAATANLFGAGTPNYTSVPDGYTGNQGLQPFTGRQGVYNLQPSAGAQDATWGLGSWMGPEQERRSLSLGLDRQFGEHWTVSLEYFHQQSESSGFGGYQVFTSLVVPAAAPTNPFGQAVRVAFDDPRMSRPGMQRYLALARNQFNLTVRGGWGDWRGFVDLGYARDTDKWRVDSFYAPIGGWDNAFLTGAYNPFLDMRVADPAAPAFYERYVVNAHDAASALKNYQANMRLSGPLFDLPAGPVQLTAGSDWSRNDRYASYWVFNWYDTGTGEVAPAAPGDPLRGSNTINVRPIQYFQFDDYAGYAEVNVPVFSPQRRLPLAERLEFFASGRLGKRVSRGSDVNGEPVKASQSPHIYAIGTRYDPIEGLGLRISQSVGFKPPTVSQVTPPMPRTTSSNAIDRRRNNESVSLAPTAYAIGGNPDLEPETTVSRNIGLIFSPRWMGNLRLSLDYIENIRQDAIESLSVQEVLDLEQDMPGRVQRGAAEPGAPNGVGPITFVDATRINLREISSKGLDITLQHILDGVGNGRLVTSLAATKQLSYKIQSTATSAPTEQVRNPLAPFSRALRWNGNAQVTWESTQWSFGWSARYFDTILARPTDYVILGSDRADSALTHDFFFSFRIPEAKRSGWLGTLLDGASITGGAKNVFDRRPRFWATTPLGAPYDSITGRSLWLQLRTAL